MQFMNKIILFLRLLEDIEFTLQSKDPYRILTISRALRELLLDDYRVTFTTSRTISNGWVPSSDRELRSSESSARERNQGCNQWLMDCEGETFAHAATDLDHHFLTVGEDGGHDVTSGELLAQ